jgi:hypothetical protein
MIFSDSGLSMPDAQLGSFRIVRRQTESAEQAAQNVVFDLWPLEKAYSGDPRDRFREKPRRRLSLERVIFHGFGKRSTVEFTIDLAQIITEYSDRSFRLFRIRNRPDRPCR